MISPDAALVALPGALPALMLGAAPGDVRPLGDAGEETFAAMVTAVAQAEQLLNSVTAWRDALVRHAVTYGTALRRTTAPASDSDAVAWREAHREAVAEVALACQVPEPTLARRVEATGLIEDHMPQLATAYRAGEVSSWHVHVLTDVLGHLHPRQLAAADAALTPRACRTDPSRLRVSARRWRARHVVTDPDLRRRTLEDRHVRVCPADEHLAWFSALLPAEQAHAAFHRISDLATTIQGPDEQRTLPQLRADVLAALLLDPDLTTLLHTEPDQPTGSRAANATNHMAGADSPTGTGSCNGSGTGSATAGGTGSSGGTGNDSGTSSATAGGTGGGGEYGVDTGFGAGPPPDWVRGIRPTLVLTVPVLSLLGHSDEPADLEGHGPIDLDTARVLAAQAPSLLRVLTHPHTGAVLGVSRDRYQIPADLRAVLQLRDATCRFPGCSRPARRCDLDHCTAWQHGGPTDEPNLAHLCRHHHRLKHHPGWSTRLLPDGTLVLRTPTGHQYQTQPATPLWPPPPDVIPSPELSPKPEPEAEPEPPF